MSLQQYQSQTSIPSLKPEAHQRQMDTEKIDVSNNPESTRSCTTLIVAPLKLIVPTLNADSIYNEVQSSTCLNSFQTHDQDSLDIVNIVAYSMDKSPTFEIAVKESMSCAIDGQAQEKEQEQRFEQAQEQRQRQGQRLDDRLDQRLEQELGQGKEQSVEQESRIEQKKTQELEQEKRKEQKVTRNPLV